MPDLITRSLRGLTWAVASIIVIDLVLVIGPHVFDLFDSVRQTRWQERASVDSEIRGVEARWREGRHAKAVDKDQELAGV